MRKKWQIVNLLKLIQLYCFVTLYVCVKDTLWVLRRDELLVHVSVDISLITKHILDHVISLGS